jgi:hypothetical protein
MIYILRGGYTTLEECAAFVFRMNVPGDGGNTILRDIGSYLYGYTVQQPKKKNLNTIL